MKSVCEIFDKYKVDLANLGALYDELRECVRDEETVLAVEKNNVKVREKNDADRFRDRLHSKLFNYVKSITYDETDPRFDDAQEVMRVLKAVGNPTRLAENVESGVIITLGNRLEPLKSRMEAINALPMLEALLEANNRFIALEMECREFTAAQKFNKGPSMGEIRKRADSVYRTIINVIDGYSQLATKRDEVGEMITEINVLVAKYDNLLMARKKADNSQPSEM
jgi:hypothetical protein